MEPKTDRQQPKDQTKNKNVTPFRPRRSLTDLGNVERFIDKHGQDLKYHTDRKKWLYWNGKHWEVIEKEEVSNMAINLVKELPLLLKQEKQEEAEDEKVVERHLKHSESKNGIYAIVELAKAYDRSMIVNESKLNKDKFLLNVGNGTIDLKKLEMHGVTKDILLPYERNHLITKYIDVPFNPEGAAPLWEKILNDIFEGNQNLINYMQRVIGYALTGSTKEDALFILYGERGRNGKSVLINIISRLLNDYSGSTSPQTFMKTQNDSKVRHSLAELVGKRLVSTSEVERGEELAVQLIKMLTGRDPIEAERKYEDPFSYYPNYKVFMLTNNKPHIFERKNAIWERIHLIPFKRYFAPHERDTNLERKLEAEMEGILTWALKGCMEWQIQGLNPPEEVREAVEAYREEQDIILQFLKECCVYEPENKELWSPPKELYENYRWWCKDNGYKAFNNKNFKEEILNKGIGFGSKRVEYNGKKAPKDVYKGVHLINS